MALLLAADIQLMSTILGMHLPALPLTQRAKLTQLNNFLSRALTTPVKDFSFFHTADSAKLVSNSVGNEDANASRPGDFPQFARLPNELQMEIWKEAVMNEEARTINLIEYGAYLMGTTTRPGKFWMDPNDRLLTDATTPPLLLVNYQSRYVALKYYEIALQWSDNLPNFYFNFDKDRIFAHSLSALENVTGKMELNGLRWQLQDPVAGPAKQFREKLKHLIVGGKPDDRMVMAVTRFSNLATLYLHEAQLGNGAGSSARKMQLEWQKNAVNNPEIQWEVPRFRIINLQDQRKIDEFFLGEYNPVHSSKTVQAYRELSWQYARDLARYTN